MGVVVYDEQVDGFQFTRSTRARKGQTAEPAPIEVVAPPKTIRKTKAASPPAEAVPNNRRKSKRLSGDKEPEKQVKAKSTREETAKPRDQSPQTAPIKLQVGKKRGGDVTTIALPFADTPVIKRNKEMRAAQSRTSSSHRRSSAGTRGRRASSLIESGSNGKEYVCC